MPYMSKHTRDHARPGRGTVAQVKAAHLESVRIEQDGRRIEHEARRPRALHTVVLQQHSV